MSGLSGALRRGRRAAIKRMRSEVIIDRIRRDEDGEPVTTTSPAGVVTEVRDVIYPDPEWPEDHPWKHGPARVHYTGTPWPATPDVAGLSVTVRPIFTSIPIGAPRIEIGDRIRVIADRDTPTLVGDMYRAIEPGNASQETAQRILCHDYSTSPLGRDSEE